MKVREIRELSPDELKNRIEEKREELANLKFQLALHQLDNTSKVLAARRDLARLRTIYREHQLEIRLVGKENALTVQENR